MAGAGDDFPVASDLLYFDAAAIGPVPRAVQMSVLDEEVEGLSLGTSAPGGSRLQRNRSAARIEAGRLLAIEPDRVAIVSSAMAALRDALAQLEVGPGNVVVLEEDYPDIVECCRRFCTARSLELRAVRSPCVDAVLDLAALRGASDRDTRLIAVSSVHSWTGRELSLGDLAELACSVDALLVVDASQAVGAVPVDARVVDLLVTAGYKWLCAELGAAVATATERVLEACSSDGRAPTAAEILEPSTMSPLATAFLRRSIEYLLELGVERIAEHNRVLTTRLREGLADMEATFATSVLSSSPHILSVRFEGLDTAQLVRTLGAEGVIVSDREGWVRWAPHLYTSADDVDRALEVVAGVVH